MYYEPMYDIFYMKRLIFSVLTCCAMMVCANAQIMRSEELEKYAKEKYGEKWVEAAENLASTLTLDKNNSLTYQQVIECGEQTKEQLYVILNYWFTASFNDANSVVKLNDKELGTIIAEGYVADIVQHMGGLSAYNVNFRPIIKVDIKDQKIRVTYTVQCYEIEKLAGGGILGTMGGAAGAAKVDEKWGLDTCYPFAAKDGHKAKKTSSKALVMVHAYSNVIMDKIEEAVKNGLVGNENEDW